MEPERKKKMSPLLTVLLGSVLTLVVAVLVFLLWASRGSLPRTSSKPVEVVADARAGDPGAKRMTVMTFNIHFGVGLSERPLPGRAAVIANLDRIGDLLKTGRVDVAALQEVDFDCGRTHGIDMAQHIARRAGMRWVAKATFWKKRYVPFPYWPPRDQYGRMVSGMAVLSRYPISGNKALLFAKPVENPWWYNAFYIDRGVQSVTLKVGERSIRIHNLHLEAFERGTRMRQAGELIRVVVGEPAARAVVLGDFNAVPPEARQKKGFPDEPHNDMSNDTTIPTMRDKLTGFVEAKAQAPGATGHKAELTFPADKPNRRLDYIFHKGLKLVEAAVVPEVISDHRPVVATFELK